MVRVDAIKYIIMWMCGCPYVCVGVIEVDKAEREESQSEMFSWVRSDANAHLK